MRKKLDELKRIRVGNYCAEEIELKIMLDWKLGNKIQGKNSEFCRFLSIILSEGGNEKNLRKLLKEMEEKSDFVKFQ